MAFCELHLNHQPALQKMVSATALIPEVAGPWATLYLLHGLSDDHTAWARWTSIERYVSGLPLLVIMPTTDRGWYVDSASDPRGAYGTFMTRDLIGFVDRTFRTRPTREGRAVAGLSMGGYGAMRLALGNPTLYAAAVSHSGALAITQRPVEKPPEWHREMGAVFGDNPMGGPNDLFTLAENLAPAQRPALRIDCGVDDFLIQHNRDFHAHLNTLGYAHEYAEHPGAHDWAYWDTHIQETIAFVVRELGLT